jgi:hypothetical protein
VLTFEQPLAGMIQVVRANQGKRSSSSLLFSNRLAFVASGGTLTRTACSHAAANLLAREGSRIFATGHDSAMFASWKAL